MNRQAGGRVGLEREGEVAHRMIDYGGEADALGNLDHREVVRFRDRRGVKITSTLSGRNPRGSRADQLDLMKVSAPLAVDPGNVGCGQGDLVNAKIVHHPAEGIDGGTKLHVGIALREGHPRNTYASHLGNLGRVGE